MEESIKTFLMGKSQSEELIIRQALVSDFKAIKKITNQQRKFLPAVLNYNLSDGLKTESLYVAIKNDEVIGMVRWHPRKDGTNTLHEIAVSNAYKNEGVGKKLFEKVPNPLQLKVTEDNKEAIKFYKKQGLVSQGIYKGKKRNLLIFKTTELNRKSVSKYNETKRNNSLKVFWV